MFGDITDAEKTGWQRRAALLLDNVLALGVKQKLPPIAWRIGTAGSNLLGECVATPYAKRRADFEAWKAAIGVAASQDPDHDTEHTFGGSDGETRLVTGWERVPVKLAPASGHPVTVTLTLVASIWPDDEEESGG
jgi:hypothetical protein